jgi:8-oxo-dGTP diphosphatase
MADETDAAVPPAAPAPVDGADPEPHLRVGAYAVCVDEGQILLTRLWSGDIDGGKWNLPGGGLDFGEHPLDGLARELQEETGLAGTVRGLLDVDSAVLEPWRGWGPLHHLRIIYAVDATGEPAVQEVGGSTVEARWWPVEDAAGLRLTSLARHGLHLAGIRAGARD